MTAKEKRHLAWLTTQPDLPGEEWVVIAGHPKYRVSNQGRVRNSWNRLLTPALRETGYLTVNLSVDGKVLTRKIHRLVAAAFCHQAGSRSDVR